MSAMPFLNFINSASSDTNEAASDYESVTALDAATLQRVVVVKAKPAPLLGLRRVAAHSAEPAKAQARQMRRTERETRK